MSITTRVIPLAIASKLLYDITKIHPKYCACIRSYFMDQQMIDIFSDMRHHMLCQTMWSSLWNWSPFQGKSLSPAGFLGIFWDNDDYGQGTGEKFGDICCEIRKQYLLKMHLHMSPTCQPNYFELEVLCWVNLAIRVKYPNTKTWPSHILPIFSIDFHFSGMINSIKKIKNDIYTVWS